METSMETKSKLLLSQLLSLAKPRKESTEPLKNPIDFMKVAYIFIKYRK